MSKSEILNDLVHNKATEMKKYYYNKLNSNQKTEELLLKLEDYYKNIVASLFSNENIELNVERFEGNSTEHKALYIIFKGYTDFNIKYIPEDNKKIYVHLDNNNDISKNNSSFYINFHPNDNDKLVYVDKSALTDPTSEQSLEEHVIKVIEKL